MEKHQVLKGRKIATTIFLITFQLPLIWRSVALTNGIDLLKTPKEVIKKQMGHLPDNKVDQAYDKSLMLEERRIFLNKWCDLLVANGLEV